MHKAKSALSRCTTDCKQYFNYFRTFSWETLQKLPASRTKFSTFFRVACRCSVDVSWDCCWQARRLSFTSDAYNMIQYEPCLYIFSILYNLINIVHLVCMMLHSRNNLLTLFENWNTVHYSKSSTTQWWRNTLYWLLYCTVLCISRLKIRPRRS